MGNTSAKPSSPSPRAPASPGAEGRPRSPSAPPSPSASPPASPSARPSPPHAEFRVLSAEQRAVTFDERVHLRAPPSADRVTLATATPLSGFRPLQRAATFDPRLRAQRGLLTAADVLHRRYFNAVEQRRAHRAQQLLRRIPEQSEDERGGRRDAVVVVDPFSTGQTLAERSLARGLACVCVWSDTLRVMQDLIAHLPPDLSARFAAEIFHDPLAGDADGPHADGDGPHVDDPHGDGPHGDGPHSNPDGPHEDPVYKTLRSVAQVPGVRVVAVLAGAETGVQLADQLSERLGLTTNGSAGSAARRNKFLMGEKVRAAGLRAVRQCQAAKYAPLAAFVARERQLLGPDAPLRVIVKPVESAGSDDVALCASTADVQRAFGNIQGKINGLGLENAATLVQEYLDGTEYVVDTVSRNGRHKCVAVWEYDKRRANDAPFVYYGVILRSAADELLSPVVDYVLRVLDALDIRHGPAHAEVKLVRRTDGQGGLEPCLVEIGARCHGGEGSYLPIVNRCLGYNHVDAALDAYLDADAFDALPERPLALKAFGCEAMLVSYAAGRLEAVPGLPEIEQMPSFVSKMLHKHAGDAVERTVDMFSTPGSVLLVHEDQAQLQRDYARVRELEHDGLFLVSPSPQRETLEQTQVAVVVDPFSTGAVLAHELMARGLACVCVYSDRLENIESVASLIPEGLTLAFTATVAFDGDLQRTVAAVQQAARECSGRVCAVFPGAELGVKLADALADALGLEGGNLLAHSNARRDKYLMGETLRAAGVRAVQQVRATTWAEAEAFITQQLRPEPFEVVLKPLESAGTEDVVLCLSLEEARRTFDGILGKVNGLGLTNQAVLLQEYLEGDEYVVDTVSRGGQHKAVAVWKYDKRRVNDAAFVYFGLSLVAADEHATVVHELIDYQLQVLDALGVRQGPAHGEVKFCRGAPVLIEVGARCHGGEGAWVPIADRCVGYNQVGAAIDSVLDAEAFAALPDRPRALKAFGCEAMLVSYRDGVLQSAPGLAEIEQMPAFLKREIFVAPGDLVRRTVDMFTTPGSIMLVHEDRAVMERSLARIRELEVDGLFTLE